MWAALEGGVGGCKVGHLGELLASFLLLSFREFRYLCGIFLLNYYFTFGSVATLFKKFIKRDFRCLFLKSEIAKERERERGVSFNEKQGKERDRDSAHMDTLGNGEWRICAIFLIFIWQPHKHTNHQQATAARHTHTLHTTHNTTKKRSMREKNSCK